MNNVGPSQQPVVIPSINEFKEQLLKDNPWMGKPADATIIRKAILDENPDATPEDIDRLWAATENRFKRESELYLFEMAQEQQRLLVQETHGKETARTWAKWGNGDLTL